MKMRQETHVCYGMLKLKVMIKVFSAISCATVRENTIGSMKNAASHGADMVEFDVQVDHLFQWKSLKNLRRVQK